jgi:hypothetical protein
MFRRTFCALCVSILFFTLTSSSYAAPQCPVLPTGTATLSGSVNTAEGGLPVPAQVIASAEFEGVGTKSFPVFTFTGTWSIEVPAPATYVVSASPFDQEHAPELYDGVLTKTAATTFSVTNGQVVNGIDFTVVVGGTLTGTVTAAGSGDPMPDVSVSAISFGDLLHYTGTTTDEAGQYTLGGLATVDYHVQFIPDPTTGDYLAESYNDKGTFSGDPVTVTLPGVSGIDASLELGGRIEGTITGPSDEPLGDLIVYAYSQTYDFGYASTDPSGFYSLLAPAGSYTVYAQAPENLVSEYYDDKFDAVSADAVAVTTSATTGGIDIKLGSSGHITGQVTDSVTKQPVEGATVTAYNTGNFVVGTTVTDVSGNYDLATGLRTGEYRLLFEGPDLKYDGTPGYVPAFYANKATLIAADPVSVSAPDVTSGIDQELTPCGQVTTTTVTTTTTLPATTTTTLPTTTTTVTVTTTTSSLPATTTTTLEQQPVCGDPAAPIGPVMVLRPIGESPRSITASDALYILRAAVGSETCALCVCDVNNSITITATDALVVLRRAVGQPVELTCPTCVSQA